MKRSPGIRFSRAALRRLVHGLGLAALVCAVPPGVWGQTCTTSITGIVFAPNNNDPLPNVLVYVPTTTVQPFTDGVNSCSAASSLVTGNPVVTALTAADGTYTLSDPSLAGTNVPLVIQAGKWRRQLVIPSVPACATTTFSTRMPQTHLEGDIPQFAIVTGSADQVECAVRKVGIADSEFTDPNGGGRVNFYLGSGSAGSKIDSATPSETVLTQNSATMNGYDIVMLPCQGGAYAKTTAEQTNLINYADAGGRVFATHYSYVWLDNDAPFSGTAKWIGGTSTITLPDGNATISSSFADATVLAQWLVNVGASTTLGQVPLQTLKQDQRGVIPPTQNWFSLNDAAAGNPSMQFTFDTPITGTQLPNVTVSFTNSPTQFQIGDTGDTITMNVQNTGTAAADPSLQLKVALLQGYTATALAGVNSNTGWVCSAAALTCTRTTPLNGGASDPIVLTVNIGSTAASGTQSVASATVSGGGISNTSQCGRVLFNEYHVENLTGAGQTFPKECNTSAATPQEKLLEYSLFDLSNFVAPVTKDTVLVLQPTSISLHMCVDGSASLFPCGPDLQTTPPPIISPVTMYYGQSADGVAVESSTNLTGTLTFYDGTTVFCTLNANLLQGSNTCPPLSGYFPVGTATVTAVYSGDSTHGGSTSNGVVFTVYPDITTATVTSSLNPATFGQAVTFTAVVGGNFSTPTGSAVFMDGTTVLATVALDPTGTATFTTSGLPLGLHGISVVYAGNTNFNPVTSATLDELIIPPASALQSAITLVSSINPSAPGQSVTFTATVSAPGTFAVVPAGTVTFMDGSTAIGSATINTTTGIATFTTSTLATGSHAMTAVYSGQTASGTGTLPPPNLPKPPVALLQRPSGGGFKVIGPLDHTTAWPVPVTVAPVALPNAAVPTAAVAAPLPQSSPATGAATIVGSTSAVLTQVVTASLSAEPVGFVLTVTPVPVTVGVGATAVLLVNVRDASGFSQPVGLSCSGLPQESTCTFVQTVIPAGGGSTTLEVQTSAPHSCGTATPYFIGSLDVGPAAAVAERAAVFVVPGLLGGLMLAVRRRRSAGYKRMVGTVVLLLASLSGLAALAGCGNCTDLGTKPGTYSFNVVATAQGGSSTAVQTQTIPMTVTIP